ncbi:MAG: fatty acid desaturase [Marinosulfonomonas sp.]|nr:fatty acid desaturase [Marinosulfonomonas sp.]
MRSVTAQRVEWLTLLLIVGCLLVWAAGTSFVAGLSLPLGVFVTGFAIALYSSLQHEVLHGHPFRSKPLNQALVFPALSLAIPYLRFRDTHLAHHRDTLLTDPFDDPESNYLDPGVWQALPRPIQTALRFNNTLLGRLLIGPIVSQVVFMRTDWLAIRGGARDVLAGWLWHIPALGLVAVWFATIGTMPLWAILLSAYLGLSILKIRTFLEHQAEQHTSHRTVIVEDRGLLAFLFLNNNLHVVHHMHPDVAWYELPGKYRANRERYLKRNNGYLYASYGEVFRRYFLSAKDAVPHPIWRRG